MEKNTSTSPSKNSPTKSPSPPPQNPPSDNDVPMETNHDSPLDTTPHMDTNPEAERTPPPPEPIMKTALEVLAELSAGDEELGGNNEGENDGGNDVSGGQDGGSVAVAIGGGGSMVIEGGGSGGMSGEGQVRKRRNVQVRDPPPGNPRCPECGREFATWKAAFGHMRKHPERTHRGFFAPPAFNCPTNTFVPQFDDGPGVDKEVVSVVRKLVTDLNQSLEKEGGTSHVAAGIFSQGGAGSSHGAAGSSQGGAGSSLVAAGSSQDAAGSSLGAAGSSDGGAGSSQGAAAGQNASNDDKKGKNIVFDLNLPPPPEDDEDMNEN